jgi:hypothetical protein
MLSRLATEFAAEIANHDWSDAPWRLDRAGHKRHMDTHSTGQVLTRDETDNVRTNVMWVTAQVLKHLDPNLDLHEYATACGVPRSITHRKDGSKSGAIDAGIRFIDGLAYPPGEPVL